MHSSGKPGALDRIAEKLLEKASGFNTFSGSTALILLISAVLLLRFPNILLPREIDVDESQMLAQGMKFLMVDPVPWRSVDGRSGGPLNSYVISLLLWMGFEPGYILVHVLASVLTILFILTTYGTLLRLTSERAALWGTLPLALCYGIASHASFLHYASELLPIILLAAGLNSTLSWMDKRNIQDAKRRVFLIFLSGFLIGLSIWCKSQALPVAGVLSLAALAAIFVRKDYLRASGRLIDLACFGGGALLPAAILLGIVAKAGVITEFWYSYVLANVSYAGDKSFTATISKSLLAFWHWETAPFLVLNVFAAALAFLAGVRFQAKERWILWTLVLYIGGAVYAVARPDTAFLHYTMFLLHPMTCLGTWLIFKSMARLPDLQTVTRKWALRTGFAFIVVVASIYMMSGYRYALRLRQVASVLVHPPVDFNERVAAQIQTIGQRHPVRSLAIWGWAPGVHVMSGIPPATRDSVGHLVISKGPMQNYFRQRFVADLRSAMPDLFIDAVASGAFVWVWGKNDGYESDPDLLKLINEEYVLVDEISVRPGRRGRETVRFFARKESGIAQ